MSILSIGGQVVQCGRREGYESMGWGRRWLCGRPVCDGTYLSSLCAYLPSAVLFHVIPLISCYIMNYAEWWKRRTLYHIIYIYMHLIYFFQFPLLQFFHRILFPPSFLPHLPPMLAFVYLPSHVPSTFDLSWTFRHCNKDMLKMLDSCKTILTDQLNACQRRPLFQRALVDVKSGCCMMLRRKKQCFIVFPYFF